MHHDLNRFVFVHQVCIKDASKYSTPSRINNDESVIQHRISDASIICPLIDDVSVMWPALLINHASIFRPRSNDASICLPCVKDASIIYPPHQWCVDFSERDQRYIDNCDIFWCIVAKIICNNRCGPLRVCALIAPVVACFLFFPVVCYLRRRVWAREHTELIYEGFRNPRIVEVQYVIARSLDGIRPLFPFSEW